MTEPEMETFRERTLANRYQPRQHLPPNFSSVLKEYAREVLRAQPEDVLQWSAAYFQRLALENEELEDQQLPPEHNTPLVEEEDMEVLAQRIVQVFATLDTDCTGLLPTESVKQALLEAFGLTLSQALYIMTSKTTMFGDGGTIHYELFARDSVRAIQYFQQTGHAFEVRNSEDATVHGLSRLDVEQAFLQMFRFLDSAETGLLPFEQYVNAMNNAPFHLTKHDIGILSIEAARNSNGEVDYEAEIVEIFDRLLLGEQFNLFDEEV